MRYYPIFLDLKGKPAVVVGGGAVTERKVRVLLESDADVTVIAPSVTPTIREWAENNQITLGERSFEPGDLAGAFCVYAGTDDHAVNVAVSQEAEQRRLLCNVVDVPALCNFIVPAIIDRGDLCIAVSTSGASPALAKKLKRELSEQFGPEWTALSELLARLRPEIKRRHPEESPRNEVLDRMLEAGVLEMLKDGRTEEAEETAWQCI